MTTRIVADRDSALVAGFHATDWSAPITFEGYCEQLLDWDVRAIVKDDEVIGAVYTKDGEVHVSVLPRWRKRWATKGIIQELFDVENPETKVSPGHEYMFDILTRLGFTHAGEGRFVKGH